MDRPRVKRSGELGVVVRHLVRRPLLSIVIFVSGVLGCDHRSETPPPRHSPEARTAAAPLASDSWLAEGGWRLGSVSLDSTAAATIARLGPALRIARDSSEDDGGMYEVRTYRYDSLEFDEVRGEVDRVLTTSPGPGTPWVVRVGLTRDSVGTLLRIHGVVVRAKRDTLDVADCGAPSAYLTVVFSAQDRVRAVQVATSRP